MTTRRKPPLTRKHIDRMFMDLVHDGASPYQKPDPNAPRFDMVKRKLPLAKAKALKRAAIREAEESLRNIKAAPLQTHEWVYVKRRKGSKAWEKAGIESSYTFPLIVSKEASDRIVNSSRTKKKKK